MIIIFDESDVLRGRNVSPIPQLTDLRGSLRNVAEADVAAFHDNATNSYHVFKDRGGLTGMLSAERFCELYLGGTVPSRASEDIADAFLGTPFTEGSHPPPSPSSLSFEDVIDEMQIPAYRPLETITEEEINEIFEENIEEIKKYKEEEIEEVEIDEPFSALEIDND